jgi:hypothetical protein
MRRTKTSWALWGVGTERATIWWGGSKPTNQNGPCGVGEGESRLDTMAQVRAPYCNHFRQQQRRPSAPKIETRKRKEKNNNNNWPSCAGIVLSALSGFIDGTLVPARSPPTLHTIPWLSLSLFIDHSHCTAAASVMIIPDVYNGSLQKKNAINQKALSPHSYLVMVDALVFYWQLDAKIALVPWF